MIKERDFAKRVVLGVATAALAAGPFSASHYEPVVAKVVKSYVEQTHKQFVTDYSRLTSPEYLLPAATPFFGISREVIAHSYRIESHEGTAMRYSRGKEALLALLASLPSKSFGIVEVVPDDPEIPLSDTTMTVEELREKLAPVSQQGLALLENLRG